MIKNTLLIITTLIFCSLAVFTLKTLAECKANEICVNKTFKNLF
jgi:hypothetical protein